MPCKSFSNYLKNYLLNEKNLLLQSKADIRKYKFEPYKILIDIFSLIIEAQKEPNNRLSLIQLMKKYDLHFYKFTLLCIKGLKTWRGFKVTEVLSNIIELLKPLIEPLKTQYSFGSEFFIQSKLTRLRFQDVTGSIAILEEAKKELEENACTVPEAIKFSETEVTRALKTI